MLDFKCRCYSFNESLVLKCREIYRLSRNCRDTCCLLALPMLACKRGELTATNNFGRTMRRARSKKKKTALGGSVKTVFVWDFWRRNLRNLKSCGQIPRWACNSVKDALVVCWGVYSDFHWECPHWLNDRTANLINNNTPLLRIALFHRI